MTMEVHTMGVIGAGTMGTGIAQVAAQAGIRVHLVDTAETAIEASRSRLQASIKGGIERGKADEAQAEEIRGLIGWELSDNALSSVDWIIEAVPEEMNLKKSVLRRASYLAREGVPLATNTSTLRIAQLAEFCDDPTRFLGMHFFNPPPAMKLVEVIPGEQTASQVAEAAVALCRRLGKTPVVAPDVPGFLVNRAFAALVAAAIDLWAAGADPAAIDQAIELGLGHKMGPLKTADLVGLDVMLAILRSLYGQTGDERFRAADKFVELVEGGKLGRKSGGGFYCYDE
jgi:3-hydroxybutyryl-CoA dehydrogenase